MPPHFYNVSSSCQVSDLAQKWEFLFGLRNAGFFVEIGAFDGETFSNTSCLADVGWAGLYVEPITEFADKCRERHRQNKSVVVVETAVSDQTGTCQIFLGDALSTLLADQVAIFESIDWAKGLHKGEQRTVIVERLDHLLHRHNVPVAFDLLVIDVEGVEDKVLSGFDLQMWQPKVLLIEIQEDHPSFKDKPLVVKTSKTVRRHIEDCGYQEFFRDHVNTIYVRGEILRQCGSASDQLAHEC